MRRVRTVVGFVVVFAAVTAATGLALRAQQQAQPSQAYDPHLGDGFILGTVVEAVTGAPVPGAIVGITYGGPVTNAVQLSLPMQTPGIPPTGVPRRVLTDGQGRFVFRQLGAGRYMSSVTAPGYMPGGYLQLKPNGTVHFIDLDDGAKRTDIVMRLWKFGAISGTVLDENGEPAVGAVVRVIERTMSGGLSQLFGARTATTDDRGVYRVANLPPSTYIAGIVPVAMSTLSTVADAPSTTPGAMPQGNGTPPPTLVGLHVGQSVLDLDANRLGLMIPPPTVDGRVATYAPTFFPAASSLAEATPITIQSGEERESVNLSVSLVSTARVSGTVSGPSGPEPNVVVALMPPTTSSPFATSMNPAGAMTLADQSGAFSLVGVPSGAYLLMAASSPPVPARGGPAPQPPAPILWALAPITVAATDVTGLTIAMKPGLRVRGRIEFEGTKEKPTPLPMIRVLLTPAEQRLGINVAPAIVDPDGQFTTGAYPPGPYFVNAVVPGWTLKGVMLGTKNVADEPLGLESNDVDGLTIVFTDQTATINGHVTDASGVSDTTAEMIVFPADTDAWKDQPFSQRRYRLLATTKTGDYEFTGLPAGDYFIVAVKYDLTDNWQDPKFMKKLVSVATRVTLKPGDKTTLPMKTAIVRPQ